MQARGGHFDGMHLNVSVARCAFGSHAVRVLETQYTL